MTEGFTFVLLVISIIAVGLGVMGLVFFCGGFKRKDGIRMPAENMIDSMGLPTSPEESANDLKAATLSVFETALKIKDADIIRRNNPLDPAPYDDFNYTIRVDDIINAGTELFQYMCQEEIAGKK